MMENSFDNAHFSFVHKSTFGQLNQPKPEKYELIETDYGFPQGFEAMERIIEGLDRPGRPTAVVCGNDYLAAGALSALDRAGIAVPGSLSIVSFNDNDFAPYLHPPLTTVRLPIPEIGERAGAYLLARLGGEDPPAPPSLGVELMVRSSTGAAAIVGKAGGRKAHGASG